jgi:hypothetical protein
VSDGLTSRLPSELPIHERHGIQARVPWLADRLGRTEVEVLALTLYGIRSTGCTGTTPHVATRLNALEHLLTTAIDMGGR